MILNNKNQAKIAIIGAGISGVTMAMRFIEAGIMPVVFDDGKKNSSQVAAGLWNPLVFKRLSPSWMVNKLLEELYNYYPLVEEKLKSSFFNPVPIYKFINDENELNMWKLKQNDADLFDLTDPQLKQINNGEYLQKMGYCTVLKSGFVNTKIYLESAISFLKSKNAYINNKINYSDFIPRDSRLIFEDFDLIVFAEGKMASENPFFDKIDFNLCKGDVITFEANLSINDAVVNNEGFIVPLGNKTYKIGSTYVWDDLSDDLTESGYNKMMDKIRSLITVDFKVLKHEVGVRPTTCDRKPVLGFHPVYKNAYVFNGMGTKGILLSPYFSKLAVKQLLFDEALPLEIDYNRFVKA